MLYKDEACRAQKRENRVYRAARAVYSSTLAAAGEGQTVTAVGVVDGWYTSKSAPAPHRKRASGPEQAVAYGDRPSRLIGAAAENESNRRRL